MSLFIALRRLQSYCYKTTAYTCFLLLGLKMKNLWTQPENSCPKLACRFLLPPHWPARCHMSICEPITSKIHRSTRLWLDSASLHSRPVNCGSLSRQAGGLRMEQSWVTNTFWGWVPAKLFAKTVMRGKMWKPHSCLRNYWWFVVGGVGWGWGSSSSVV